MIQGVDGMTDHPSATDRAQTNVIYYGCDMHLANIKTQQFGKEHRLADIYVAQVSACLATSYRDATIQIFSCHNYVMENYITTKPIFGFISLIYAYNQQIIIKLNVSIYYGHQHSRWHYNVYFSIFYISSPVVAVFIKCNSVHY